MATPCCPPIFGWSGLAQQTGFVVCRCQHEVTSGTPLRGTSEGGVPMRTTLCALVALTLSSGATVLAQEFRPDPVNEAAAKREGKVTWYTSTAVAQGQYIANEFEKRFGIK